MEHRDFQAIAAFASSALHASHLQRLQKTAPCVSQLWPWAQSVSVIFATVAVGGAATPLLDAGGRIYSGGFLGDSPCRTVTPFWENR